MSSVQDPLAPYIFTPRILWLALMMANVMMFTVVTLADFPRDAPFDPLFFFVLAAVSVFVGVVHVVLPPRLRARSLEGVQLETTEQADPNGSVIFREAAPTIRVFAHPGEAAKKAAALFTTPFILGMALAESIGVYGTVLVALGCPIEQAVAFPAIAALLMARLFPTRKAVLGPLERHFGAQLRVPQD